MKTMLRHFEKLNTPLKSVFTYPTLGTQCRRFSELGWTHVDAENLWQVWSNDGWISPEERRTLDKVEPFDEWEELALFGTHYCVVTASTDSNPASSVGLDASLSLNPGFPVMSTPIRYSEHEGSRGQRRFGAAMSFRNSIGQKILANTFGLGTNSRLRSYDLHNKEIAPQDIEGSHPGPKSRMCHAITNLGCYGNLLSGGRASPTSAFRDCWLFNKGSRSWTRLEDLPLPLYRHAVTRLGHTDMALLVGGKTGSSSIFEGCFLYRPGSGWVECKISGSGYRPAFGATIVSFEDVRLESSGNPPDITVARFHGIFVGGMLEYGTISRQLLRWSLLLPTAEGCPTITFEPLTAAATSSRDDVSRTTPTDVLVNRFGASVLLSKENRIVMIGGVVHGDLLPRKCDILLLEVSGSEYRIRSACGLDTTQSSSSIPRPLLIGTSTLLDKDDDVLVIMGGGATCFSMGTFWNRGCYSIPQFISRLSGQNSCSNDSDCQWKFSQLLEVTEELPLRESSTPSVHTRITRAEIPRVRITDTSSFMEILKRGNPVVIEGDGPGMCVQTWTSDYLAQKVGPDRKVKHPPPLYSLPVQEHGWI